jgi:hypothetical protein
MELLVSVEGLWASLCVHLKSMGGLVQGTELRHPSGSGSSELEELPSMESLTSLEEFHTDSCVKLKSIQGHCN